MADKKEVIEAGGKLRMQRRIAAQKAAHKTRIFEAYKVLSNPRPGVVETLSITVEADDMWAAQDVCDAYGYTYLGNKAFMDVEEAYMDDLNRRWPDISHDEHGELLADCFGG